MLRTLDFDFFRLLDSVTIARSRKHIERYCNTSAIGKFPERLKPISRRPCLTDLPSAINYNEIYEQLMQLRLCVYTPTDYIFHSSLQKYFELTASKGDNLTRQGRERGIRHLRSTNHLKRLENSVHSFQFTLTRIKNFINATTQAIDAYELSGVSDIELYQAQVGDFDIDDSNTDYFTVGKNVETDLADIDRLTWRMNCRLFG